jgi:hypothetical protein
VRFPRGRESDSRWVCRRPLILTNLSPNRAEGLCAEAFGRVAELRRTVAAQRDEIAGSRADRGRPHIKPSGMEQASDLKPPNSPPKRPRGQFNWSQPFSTEDRPKWITSEKFRQVLRIDIAVWVHRMRG